MERFLLFYYLVRDYSIFNSVQSEDSAKLFRISFATSFSSFNDYLFRKISQTRILNCFLFIASLLFDKKYSTAQFATLPLI